MSDATPADVSAKPQRRFRRLRIAVSVVFGVLTLLLVVLWVRSYWRSDVVYCPVGRQVIVNSLCGIFQVNIMPNDARTGWGPGWGWNSFAFDDMSEQRTNQQSWAWYSYAGITSVSFPVWSVILLCWLAAVAAYRTPRFSLRTMLIATTLVAVVLGLIAWSLR